MVGFVKLAPPRCGGTVRIELVFRTADGDRFEMRDASSDFEGHAHGVKLGDGAVFTYAGRRWLVRPDPAIAQRFICTPVEQDG
jgi:hypothetical protein